MKPEYKPLDAESARQAHQGTSFDPDKRGHQEIEWHKEVFYELAAELGGFFEQKHADKLSELWTAYLYSHATVVSSMITGPARFPVERNRKRSEWADNKRKAIFEYCDNLKKWKGKADRREAIEAAGGELAVAKAKLEGMKDLHEKMKAANRIIRAAPRNEITDEKRERLMNLGLKDQTVAMITKPNCFGGLGFESFHLTNSNAGIKNTAARVAELERREANKDKESEDFDVPGGKVVYDYAENRINVEHAEKPSREIIDIIKGHGFRWSRNYGHWTRKMTPNAKYSAENLIKTLNI